MVVNRLAAHGDAEIAGEPGAQLDKVLDSKRLRQKYILEAVAVELHN